MIVSDNQRRIEFIYRYKRTDIVACNLLTESSLVQKNKIVKNGKVQIKTPNWYLNYLIMQIKLVLGKAGFG